MAHLAYSGDEVNSIITGNNYNSRLVAKNTLILYVRMFFMLIISLYTSRVILNTLGIEDYGTYEVVGGFVSLFSILSSSLSVAISRFITFALGKGDLNESIKVYSSSVIIQVAMALAIGLLSEVIGLWYFNHYLNIPADRLQAAFWALHCSIITFGLSLISVPFNAEIVAHEDMKVYAYFSILDAVIALTIVLLLRIIPADKLVIYAVLNVIVALLMRFLYAIYCKRNYAECHFTFQADWKILKQIGAFTGWHLLGESTWIINNQGANLLVNSYFGVTMNAARGIAGKVSGLIGKFSGNFMTALSPQITKVYAEGDLKSLHALLFRGSKLSYYLMLILAVPIFFESPILLKLWLGTVPEKAVLFSRLTIINSLIIVLGTPLVKAQLATGNLKKYQIIISLCSIVAFPVTWIGYHAGLPAEWSYIVFNLVYFAILFVRVYLVKDLIQLPWKEYFRDVFMKVFIVTVLSAVIPLVICRIQEESLIRLIETVLAGTAVTCFIIYTLGLNKQESGIVQSYTKSLIDRVFRRGTAR